MKYLKSKKSNSRICERHCFLPKISYILEKNYVQDLFIFLLDLTLYNSAMCVPKISIQLFSFLLQESIYYATLKEEFDPTDPYFCIGDEAFACEQIMLTPISQARVRTREERAYNRAVYSYALHHTAQLPKDNLLRKISFQSIYTKGQKQIIDN